MSNLRPPRYLFVCTANVHRSPMAAFWAELALSDVFVEGEIRSAGTLGWNGVEAGADAIEAMRRLGHDLRNHRSTGLSRELVTWADYIVVMEPAHEEAVAKLDAASADRVVRMWEFLEDPADHVVDPIGSALPAFERTAVALRSAVTAMVAAHREDRFSARKRTP